ncbi:MAG: ribose 5-phosphate isomerase B [Bacillota bacterium]|nr:MAG: ribose 5-phosphate isomerase B [Bacillota bacterium]
MPERRVLIVCSGNTCRSPMAAAYLRAALDRVGLGDVRVESAGLYALPDLPAPPEARQAVAEHGISLAGHRSRAVDADVVRDADLILAMTRSHAEQLRRRFPEIAGRVAVWREFAAGRSLEDPDVPDPFGQSLNHYRIVARQLEREAREVAARLQRELPRRPGGPGDNPVGAGAPGEVRGMRIAIGSDHAGYDLKQDLIQFLVSEGYEVIDVGTDSRESCDYPDFARAVCEKVVGGEAARGVLICGTGIGMAIAANKVPGIRAACCTDPYSARLTRQDNDSNVLTLGARVVGPGLAREILAVWLSTPFAGGRHQRRVEKIAQLEAEFARGSGRAGAGGGE